MTHPSSALPPLPTLATIRRRLPLIFPEGTNQRSDATNELAAAVAFVMLYAGAVEGADRWVRPDQVTRMTDAQAAKLDEASRLAWAADSMRRLKKGEHIAGRWYAHGTREGIRDDTIRNAWLPARAVVKRQGLATTSDRPTWALDRGFAELLTWGLPPEGTEPADIHAREESEPFKTKLAEWQDRHLSREARARVELLRRLTSPSDAVVVQIPGGGSRNLAPGLSSRISKAVIEEFGPRFLNRPGVIWLSESSDQQPLLDSDIARAVGLNINDSGILPDIIMVDLAPEKPLLVFCEVVATDGPMNEARKLAILELVSAGGYDASNVVLMTAFIDRSTAAYKNAASALATGSFAWTASEPDKIIWHYDAASNPIKLTDIVAWRASRPHRSPPQ